MGPKTRFGPYLCLYLSYRALLRCKSISAMRSSRHEHRELNPREGLTGGFWEGGSPSRGRVDPPLSKLHDILLHLLHDIVGGGHSLK